MFLMKKVIYISTILFLVFSSCSLLSSNYSDITINAALNRSFTSDEIESITLEVSGPGMKSITRVSEGSFIQVSVEHGLDRHFILTVTLRDGRVFTGESTVDINNRVGSVSIILRNTQLTEMLSISFLEKDNSTLTEDAIAEKYDNLFILSLPEDIETRTFKPTLRYDGLTISPGEVETDYTNTVEYVVTSISGETEEYQVMVRNGSALLMDIQNNIDTSINYTYDFTSISLSTGDSFTLTPILPENSTDITYSWYIDGVNTGSNSGSYTLNYNDYSKGAHSISCVVTSGNELFTIPVEFLIIEEAI